MLRFCEMTARFRVVGVQRERLVRRSFRSRISLQWFHEFIGQPNPNLCYPRPGTRQGGVLIKRLLKKSKRLAQLLFACLIRQIESAEIKLIRGGIHRRHSWSSKCQLYLQLLNNRTRDFILYCEDALQFALEGRRPKIIAIAR